MKFLEDNLLKILSDMFCLSRLTRFEVRPFALLPTSYVFSPEPMKAAPNKAQIKIHFYTIVPFLQSLKDFLTFSGGIGMEYWATIG